MYPVADADLNPGSEDADEREVAEDSGDHLVPPTPGRAREGNKAERAGREAGVPELIDEDRVEEEPEPGDRGGDRNCPVPERLAQKG